jgi:hypothetical protein
MSNHHRHGQTPRPSPPEAVTGGGTLRRTAAHYGRPDKDTIATAAIDLIRQQLHEPDRQPQDITVPFTLIVRASTTVATSPAEHGSQASRPPPP